MSIIINSTRWRRWVLDPDLAQLDLTAQRMRDLDWVAGAGVRADTPMTKRWKAFAERWRPRIADVYHVRMRRIQDARNKKREAAQKAKWTRLAKRGAVA